MNEQTEQRLRILVTKQKEAGRASYWGGVGGQTMVAAKG